MELLSATKPGQAVFKSLFQVEGLRANSTTYSILEHIVQANEHIPIDLRHEPRLSEQSHVKRPTVVVFADDRPTHDWAHRCRFLLFDAHTSELYHEIHANLPPLQYPANNCRFTTFHRPRLEAPEVLVPIQQPPDRWYPFSTGRRYALMFSGWTNLRHLNDLEFIYRTLVRVYSFDPNDITILNLNGTPSWTSFPGDSSQLTPKKGEKWPGDNTNFTLCVNHPGTRDGLNTAINNLRSKLLPEDHLFLFVTNHCYRPDTELALGAYNSDPIPIPKFRDILGTLPPIACLNVMMQQCFSGAFIAPILSNVNAADISIAAASGPCAESSVGNGLPFSIFSCAWISAVAGADPYGAAVAINTGSTATSAVTARDAFNYAQAKVTSDLPLFRTKGQGATQVLGQPLTTLPGRPLIPRGPERDLWIRLLHERGPRLKHALDQMTKIEKKYNEQIQSLELERLSEFRRLATESLHIEFAGE